MRFVSGITIIGIIAVSTAALAEGPQMNFEKLSKIINKAADKEGEVRAQAGVWQFTFRGVPIMCVADQRHNRMRLISPILKEADVTKAQRVAMFRANFHTALDARYAVGNGTLFAAFLHPLDSLTERDLLSGIRQVASLAETFGDTYSSGELMFPGSTPKKRPKDQKHKKTEL